MRNPPAFDQILIDNYESLERTVDPRWLPLPVLVASKAAQHIRMRREHLLQSEAWAAHLRTEGNEAEAKEYLERTKRLRSRASSARSPPITARRSLSPTL